MKKVHRILSFFIMTFIGVNLSAQSQNIEGSVSFVTANSIYVKFASTEQISIGDTLLVSQNNSFVPCLVVTKKSSSSTVNESIQNCELVVDQKVYFKTKINDNSIDDISSKVAEVDDNNKEDDDNSKEDDNRLITEDAQPNPDKKLIDEKKQTDVRGRMSVASYSNLSSREDADSHRLMVRANVRAYNINNSKFSAETYINYRQNFLEREVPEDYQTKFLRLYNLAVTYQVDSSLWISAGRKINRKISSIGAVDGIQGEKQWGNFYTGGIVGFKPDLFRFDFNSKFFEYGAYGGYRKQNKKSYSETTVGFLELRNSGIVDRRYTYLQHSSNFNRKLNLFSSIEVDLFQNIAGVKTTKPRLTNLYVSARYRFSRAVNLTISYDNRKRIIFYETFRTDIERLLADDEARQGVRMRINIKPFKRANAGVSYSKRFQSDGLNASDNFNVFFSYSKLPLVNGRLALNYNNNASNYLQNQIYSIRHSRTLIPRKLNGDFYFRYIRYNYVNSENKFQQNYLGGSLRYRINKTISLSFMGEMSRRNDETNYRINTRIIKRIR